ncbi:MAG: ABC transporter ATP-binding protein [Chitinophagaceae bacterium]|nr:ABC transporter ATP-binding protein [Oligoflexus sp.]
MSDLAIEATDVWKSYKLGDTKVDALRGLSLQLKYGELAALVGASGSGKSTLLNLLGALDKPDRGSIAINNRQVEAMSDEELGQLRNRKIGFIFQAFHLIPVLKTRENVALPLQLFDELSSKDRKMRVESALEKVGLLDFADSMPTRLSGGQRQRVAIARALVTEPDLILADEPTANLDSKTAHAIIDLLEELNSKQKASFLISSHDEKLIGRVKRVLRIQDGTIV